MNDPKDCFPENYFPEKELPDPDPEMKDLEPLTVEPFQEHEILLDQDTKKTDSETTKL
jgi:hypothetical protein